MAEANELQPPVKFLGHVSRDQLPAVYAGSTIVVMPSVFVEAFGKVGPEALSSGRPVIASDSGGVREWLQPGKERPPRRTRGRRPTHGGHAVAVEGRGHPGPDGQ